MLEVQIKKKLPHFLVDINLTVEDEILVLVGPSGSGKTTILNAIAGLDHPDDGRITLNGNIFFCDNEKPLPTQQRNIGYLFQDYALFPHMTVEKNIAYGVKKMNAIEAEKRIERLVNTLGINHLLSKYPHQISGGEKQRVALARALATEPSLLLLDEPLSALDSRTRLECQEELQRLHATWKTPFIIVTHDMQEAEKLGDKIIFLESGLITKTVDNRSGKMIC
ncbi:ABC transporter ATP-binding protein [Sporosarcina jiandibaonis]|uniref:ABC transporter ATP-binding protein n=1 Tax=Sporosarcina jiandibaonis TaxID=2715535 RepID=UPI001552CE73|nr:ABC transporter ATP-binding protein [Sporosarcina jiandibaonis]